MECVMCMYECECECECNCIAVCIEWKQRKFAVVSWVVLLFLLARFVCAHIICDAGSIAISTIVKFLLGVWQWWWRRWRRRQQYQHRHYISIVCLCSKRQNDWSGMTEIVHIAIEDWIYFIITYNSALAWLSFSWNQQSSVSSLHTQLTTTLKAK